MTDYLDQIADFAACFAIDDIPDHVVHRAKLVLADSIGAIVGGAAEPEIQSLAREICKSGGPASILGTRFNADPAKAAFVNGSAGTFLEMDEGNQFCKGHPGMHAIPAILATVDEMAAHGKPVTAQEFLAALVIGYEIGARVGIACNLRLTGIPSTWAALRRGCVARLKG